MALYRKVFLATRKGLISSAHDCSEGGLLVALAESCIGGRCGAKVSNGTSLHPVRFYFSESASRLLISCSPEHERELLETLEGSPLLRLGHVQAAPVVECDDQGFDLDELYGAWRQPLKELE
jgi:phosphoribosylformylglycinamidine synthase